MYSNTNGTNDRTTDRSTDRTVIEILRDRATHQPDHIAYQFLKGGDIDRVTTLTYGELDRQAWAIANYLIHSLNHQGYCATNCETDVSQPVYPLRALLIYPYESGLDFIVAFFGCLYAGIIAVPCHPPRQERDMADLKARFDSAGAIAILSVKSLLSQLKAQFNAEVDNTQIYNAQIYDTSELKIATSDIGKAANEAVNPVNSVVDIPDLDAIAFLQYTSGSTGIPKGVMITHRCICAHQRMLATAFGSSDRTINVGWLPLFHDMGLVGNVLQPMYLGVPSILMSPIAFVQKPLRWLEAIAHFRATTSGAPNFAYDLLCRHVTPEQRQTLDLSSWTLAFSGAEAVRAESLDQFVDTFAVCGFRRDAFYPCYGMAEATLFIAGGDAQTMPLQQTFDAQALRENRVVVAHLQLDQTCRTLVSCGWAWGETEIVIVDPSTLQPCASDQVGEIWVSGTGISPGYWQLPEQTETTFRATLNSDAGLNSDATLNSDSAIATSSPNNASRQFALGDRHFLRTGDLGFFYEGNLFITGRLKEMLVFWGFNHYPQQIEQTVANCHPAFRSSGCAAFAITVEGEERLAIAQEVDRQFRHAFLLSDIVETIRWQVFQEHFVDVYAIVLVKPNRLPRTTSGKLQRQRCQQQFLQGELAVLEEWRSPTTSDITQLMGKYMNLVTHIQRYWLKLRGIWRQTWNSKNIRED
jgi:acyl-CoA synthetase (AMP-forming)/AMP-acid ligase II